MAEKASIKAKELSKNLDDSEKGDSKRILEFLEENKLLNQKTCKAILKESERSRKKVKERNFY